MTKTNKGFTLLEVVIAVSLLAFVSVVSLSVVANLLRSAVKSQSAVDIEQASNFVLLKLKNDLQKAYKVEGGGNSIDIYPINSAVAIVYSVEECNISAGIYCIKRNGVALTDADSSDPSIDIAVKDGSTPYFGVITDPSDATRSLAVNVAIRFIKPDMPATGSGNFSGETLLDTTIVLPSQQ